MIRVTYQPVRALVPHVPIQENNYFIFSITVNKIWLKLSKFRFFPLLLVKQLSLSLGKKLQTLLECPTFSSASPCRLEKLIRATSATSVPKKQKFD